MGRATRSIGINIKQGYLNRRKCNYCDWKMKDVKELMLSASLAEGDLISVSGWIVDRTDGLFLLGDHFPENYDFPYKVKIKNGNIIYPILRSVPSLGGGRSLLFYKASLFGVVTSDGEIFVKNLSIQADRSRGEMVAIDVCDESVSRLVSQFGEYQFDRSISPQGDWLDQY